MTSRNQNRAPRSPFSKKSSLDEVPLDKRRRIETRKPDVPSSMGRQRPPLVVVKQDAAGTSDIGSVEGTECANVEFTKEEVEALLIEKLKVKKFDHKGKAEQLADYSKRLKLCIKWLQQVEEGHILEEEKLRDALASVEKKCADIEVEMKNKVDELNAVNSKLRESIANLEEKLAKEESEKLDAIASHRSEKEARDAAEKLQASLSQKLEIVREEKLVADKKVSSYQDLYNRAQEYNKSLQQYNSKLQKDLETATESLKRVEDEKRTVLETLSNLRVHNKALQDELTKVTASLEETLKQKELLDNEIKCLRGELQQVRDDRDRHAREIQDLRDQVVKYKENTEMSCEELDRLMRKSKALEERDSSQKQEMDTLKHELNAANDKLKMVSQSASETLTEFDRTVRRVIERERKDSGKLDFEARVPIPFSVFPSAYRNAEVKESTQVKVEGEAKVSTASHGREGHEETHESFSATVHAPQHRDTYVKEEVRIHEEDRLRRPQHTEKVHIHEQTRYKQPEQQHRQERTEVHVSRDRYQPPPSSSSSHSHIEVQDRSYDRHFNTVHGPATDYAPSQIDVSERQFRERTRPIVAETGYSNLSTHANEQQASRYTRETVTTRDSHPYRAAADPVDSRYPSEVRVEKTTRSTVDAPKKYKRDMGYYDDDGHYHSFRHGISKAAHKVAERVAHPIHPHRHQHYSHEHSHTGSKHDDRREDIVVKEKYTTAIPAQPPSRPVQSGAPVERVVRVSNTTYSGARPSGPSVPAAPATARKMASPNTITIPCHHIRIGDLLILQGRPCQVIRITTSSQTGQHRYLGVDLFTKQLHEESSFISNPAPSVVVQNMLGPVFKQYRVLDIREDGRVVAMTESGDVKQGLPVLDQSALLSRLTESFDNGRGSVRILVINDDGLEMAVDYKVVHGSRL